MNERGAGGKPRPALAINAKGGNIMCPACLTTAVLIAGGVASTGGLAVVAMKRLTRNTSRTSDSREPIVTPDRHESSGERDAEHAPLAGGP